MVFSTQSLLLAVGLGVEAIPIAATLNWVIKDGAGQVGGMIFARFFFFPPDPISGFLCIYQNTFSLSHFMLIE